MITRADRIAGSLYGLAYGDSMAGPTEFKNVRQIIQTYGRSGPAGLAPGGRVTDDTDMMLSVGSALVRMAPEYQRDLEDALIDHFIDWSTVVEGFRAPGSACLAACRKLATGTPWREATGHNSKGCGANMRVTPVGMLGTVTTGVTVDEMAGIAQLQAAITHGHPTALAASDLTAYAVRLLLGGVELAELPGVLRMRCASQASQYHGDWLGDLWKHAGASSPQAYIRLGWRQCARALDRLIDALRKPKIGPDPCLTTGAGWIAEEALATALHCALLLPNNPVGALRRAAVTSGDSDSIAALCGAFHGAAGGMGVWPAAWRDEIEWTESLATLAEALEGM